MPRLEIMCNGTLHIIGDYLRALFLGVFRKLKVGREKTQAQFWGKNSKYWSQLKILSKKVREN